jgi:hypothetical protein
LSPIIQPVGGSRTSAAASSKSTPHLRVEFEPVDHAGPQFGEDAAGRHAEALADPAGEALPRFVAVVVGRDQPVDVSGAAAVRRRPLGRPTAERGGPVDQRVVQIDEQQHRAPV